MPSFKFGGSKSRLIQAADRGGRPLRAELFSPEELAQHALSLAQFHQVETRKGGNSLLSALALNQELLRGFNKATLAVRASRQVTPAAEWLLDNFYFIEEQIRLARRHLPRGYSEGLPRLLKGTSAGLPRVHDLALELIVHADAQIDLVSLSCFITAYQSRQTLALGELWAVPIMLRLALIENLQRITCGLLLARQERDLADAWVGRLQEIADKDPASSILVLAELARSNPPPTSSFVSEFCRRLSGPGPVQQSARVWMDHYLSVEGLSSEVLMHQESQSQAADQVSVRHSITSLRVLGTLDWNEFVEAQSAVNGILDGDPPDVYRHMDFPTRDSYRHAVEELARRSSFTEVQVAQKAVGLASECARRLGLDARAGHVGYYLVDKGLEVLAGQLRVRWGWRAGVERCVLRFPLSAYVGSIGILSVLFSWAFVMFARGRGLSSGPLFVLTTLLFLCATQWAVSLVNRLSSLIIHPRLLPRLDFSKGISEDCRTMVVVPAMLSDEKVVEELLQGIEVHFLSNRDKCLHFALLTDFVDAPMESMPGDEVLLNGVREGIGRLNRRYDPENRGLFYLFHRPRRLNVAEGLWMGYERKRGKIMQFNERLRGAGGNNFSECLGNVAVFPLIKYVITLDADTVLPRDAARQLAGLMAHRLNRPEFNPGSGVVREGYGILQPRVGVSVPGSRRSVFAWLFSSEPGINPYTREVSDVYQDLFKEGSFIGKGIYDVDAFQRAMQGRCPENTVLSHDLLEACHARSALVSDVELYEEYPSRYNVDIRRRHRWMRGDWQISQWLLPRVPGPDLTRIANPLTALSKWKILDNLRRSLVPVAMLGFLLGVSVWWTACGPVGILIVPLLVLSPGILFSLVDFFRKSEDDAWSFQISSTLTSLGRQSAQAFLVLVFMPYDAFVSLDAIGRTLLRLLVTRRRLLEWRTAGDAEGQRSMGPAGFHATMWPAPVLGVGCGILALHGQGSLSPALAVMSGLWLSAPLMAWWISRPREGGPPELTGPQRRFLGRVARRTWRFFEVFVTAGEHWLPPDNFQEVPEPRIAARTSPTNIGLALLANLGAHDLGYIALPELLQRTRDTLSTLRGLERYRGHCYNWYETRTLRPCLPLYVSSVDNGNLAGHLLTLGSGLRGLADDPLCGTRIMEGLGDTFAALGEHDLPTSILTEVGGLLQERPLDVPSMKRLLERLVEPLGRLRAQVPVQNAGAVEWSSLLLTQTQAWLDFHQLLTPSHEGAVPDPAVTLTLRALSGNGEGGAASSGIAGAWMQELETLALEAEELAAMDFSVLYDQRRNLFTVGYRVAEQKADESYYDLLASESRLCSYVAIALGQVPQKHWFSLGRLLLPSGGGPLLASWSGSMFEYLMPLLVMPSYEGTLLDQSCRLAVRRQVEYARSRGHAWGVSESGYNWTDLNQNYQYRAFGVAGLGLKRGLGEDEVVAPYATALALLVAPVEACANLQRLSLEGLEGPYGFYEAVDYTPSRQPPGGQSRVVRSFMAHHQGMTLLACDHVLRDSPMQRRFLSCPLFKTVDLLLQERVPHASASQPAGEDMDFGSEEGVSAVEGGVRTFTKPTPTCPEFHLLSNGRYHIGVTSSGGSYSRWMDLALTRWREDATCDNWGLHVYLRHESSADYWSAAYQPVQRASDRYEVVFTPAAAEYRQWRGALEQHLRVSVSSEDDVELRRLTLTNRGTENLQIEITSYAEPVLSTAAADQAHTAFGNLFVQTEFMPAESLLLCTRRPSYVESRQPWLVHAMHTQAGTKGGITCESDRVHFLGRGRTPADPAAMQRGAVLANTSGSVLDPALSLRRIVCVPAQSSCTVDLIVGFAWDREGVLGLARKYENPRMVERAFDLAWTHSQVRLRHLGVNEAEAGHYGRMAGHLVYADTRFRSSASLLRSNRRGQDGLWSHGISGTLPILLLRLGSADGLPLLSELLKAHAYWRIQGLAIDLVVFNEDISGYRQTLHDQITGLVASSLEAQYLDKPGGVFVRRAEQLSIEDRMLLLTCARVVMDAEGGSLAEQLEHHVPAETKPPVLTPSRATWRIDEESLPERDLIFRNGLGGFTRDGREYVITLTDGQMTPAPWSNVLANSGFGTVVTESGGACTWSENAHEFRLTPWYNDPVRDTTGEAFYLRDEESGETWSPTPLPAKGRTPYVIRHGFGYTVYEHSENGIRSELWVYVSVDAPVKFMVLKLWNCSGANRRVSVFGFWEWAMGELRESNLLHVVTEVDLNSGVLLARNHYNTTFAGRIAFLDANERAASFTGDRREFLGRNGSHARPAALLRTRLSGRVGPGLDPCAALQLVVELPQGQKKELNFRLGVGRDIGEVQELVRRFRCVGAPRKALEQVWEHWNGILGAVKVETPEPAVDVMVNGWLLYQTLSSRVFARAGFYQSGGAYGFRDQLQDVLALMHARPDLTREHLLRVAARQFRDGDVQHWWHPPQGKGVRTACSDDFLWLPYTTSCYVNSRGDTGVLEEKRPWLESRTLRPGEESLYDQPSSSEDSATLYEHCTRAIERGLHKGPHGLPLIGGGDWNDGMDRVGHKGRGESVWLGFFLYDVLLRFAPVARARKDGLFAARCLSEAELLRLCLEQNAWDGAWYRRAYFDDGTPLGSRENPECQIDVLPQAWSVLSGAGSPARCAQAMDSLLQRLFLRDEGVLKLLDPPFSGHVLEPGYIMGYIPGVRENGGQYSHAAVWAAMAQARLGRVEEAWATARLLNPVLHSSTGAECARYKVEPYVMAADLYTAVPHVGRGGWTWYTGSAGWMYRLLTGSLLGLEVEGGLLRLKPCVPAGWSHYVMHYRYHSTWYHIELRREVRGGGLWLDGGEVAEDAIRLVDDRQDHHVVFRMD